MGSEWRTATVGEVAVQVTKGTTPTTIGGRFVDHGVNFVKVESITGDGRLDMEKVAHIDGATNDLLARSVLREDDVLFTIAGTIGRVALVSSSALPANTNQAVAIIRPNQDAVVPRFLYYVLRDSRRLQLANTRVVQSVQANFSLAELRTLEIPLPPLSDQRAIAHILGTLDDRIEVNRGMSETLEAIAQALFKSWFVDFDPVRAKSEGRDPGLPPHLADLFPDSFDDSELGEIPREWDVLPLSKVCERITDGSHSSPISVDVGRPMASVKDMRQWGFELAGCRRISEPDYQKLVRDDCRPRACDVLIAKDGSYLKHIFVVERDLDLVILSSIAILRPNGQMDPHLLAFSLRNDGTMARMEQYVSGAVLQRIVLKDFRQFPLLVPPTNLQRAWARTVTPIVQRCWRNVDESAALAALRDTLLPRLISGELPVDRGPNGERRK